LVWIDLSAASDARNDVLGGIAFPLEPSREWIDEPRPIMKNIGRLIRKDRNAAR